MRKIKLVYVPLLCAMLWAGRVSAQADIEAGRPVLDSLEALLGANLTKSQRLDVLEQISFLHYNVDSTEISGLVLLSPRRV